ncbi:MAG: hypothetical protein KAS32_28075 [Candidatus Peribacteraceae bacterium]|nr:hypothetical protein [Candidatus Peribacteraceae bacterium]
MEEKRTVPAEAFCETLAENIYNDKLSDEDFRRFVRNTMPIVIFKEEHKETE